MYAPVWDCPASGLVPRIGVARRGEDGERTVRAVAHVSDRAVQKCALGEVIGRAENIEHRVARRVMRCVAAALAHVDIEARRRDGPSGRRLIGRAEPIVIGGAGEARGRVGRGIVRVGGLHFPSIHLQVRAHEEFARRLKYVVHLAILAAQFVIDAAHVEKRRVVSQHDAVRAAELARRAGVERARLTAQRVLSLHVEPMKHGAVIFDVVARLLPVASAHE